MAISSSAAVVRGRGILEKHKRQASRGRRTLRCHCQPHQQAAIESVPLRNLGKWKQRGSESAFPPPLLFRYTESSRTCQVWKIETAREIKVRVQKRYGKSASGGREMRKYRLWRKNGKMEPTEGRLRVFAKRWSEEIYTETIDLSGLSWYKSGKTLSW